jgi:tetratricopeptide (TPR) repeat protein
MCAALSACAGAPIFTPEDSMSADAHFRLGAAYEAANRQDDAAKQYQSVVNLTPENTEAWVALGNVEFKLGKFALAESAYRRALNVSPDHVGAQNNLAYTYLTEKTRLAEAETLAKSALRHSGPLKPYVLDTLAEIYEAEGRGPEARAMAARSAGAAMSAEIALAPPGRL